MAPSPLTNRPPLVFISYDLQEVELRPVVLDLANRLRRDGVDARIDLYETNPAEGWEHWRERQLLAADSILVVCTASYRRHFEATHPTNGGLQVKWEAGFLRRRLHDDPAFGARVLPVLLPGAGQSAVPVALGGRTPHVLPSGYDDLYRALTGQPAIVGPPLGTLRRRIDNLARRPPVFEGRKDDLRRLHQALERSGSGSGITVLTGMGGVGKTRLALEHAHRSEASYDVRWWLRAGEPSSLHEDLVRLGQALGILSHPDRVEQSTQEVLEWLSTHQRWLVVLDDAERPAAIRDLLPCPCRGHVLVTSSTHAWRSIAEVVELEQLDSPAATQVLVRRSGRRDDGHADAVGRTLGYLPLALVQAGAYIEATGCSFRAYLDRLEQEGPCLFRDDKSCVGGERERVVGSTWEISLTTIRERSPAAAMLLEWLAFLDPAGVPIALLRQHDTLLPQTLAECIGSARALDDAVAMLLEFGMLERDDDVLRVHRLVQAVTRDKLAPAERRRAAATVAQWVCAVFCYVPGETLVRDVPVGSAEQVMAAGTLGACVEADASRISRALIDVGDFHLVRGASQAARSAYERAKEIHEAQLRERPGCAQAQRALSMSLNRLGNFELRVGNPRAARECFRRAFELRRALVIAEPCSLDARLDLASSLGKLGDVALRHGDPREALALLGRAVDLHEALAEAMPRDALVRRDLAMALDELGRAHVKLGSLGDARELLRRALDIVEALARDKPRSAGTQRELSLVVNTLGDVHARLGDHRGARAFFRRGLSIAEALVREDPDSAQARRELSMAFNRWGVAELDAGHLSIARGLFKRGLELRRALAEADPGDVQAQRDLALSLGKLGELEARAGDLDAALVHLRRATGVHMRLVRNDPRNTQAHQDLAASIARQDALSKDTAVVHIRRAHEVFRAADQTFTGHRIVTRSLRRLERPPGAAGRPSMQTRVVPGRSLHDATDLRHLAQAQARIGNLGTARELFILYVDLLGARGDVVIRSSHARRDLGEALYALGKVELRLGDLEAARATFRRCIAQFHVLATASPRDAKAQRDLAVALTKLAKVEERSGDLDCARGLFERGSEIFERLVADAPHDRRARRDLALLRLRQGSIAMYAGALDEARGLLQRSIRLFEELAQESSEALARRDLAASLAELAAVEARARNFDVARHLLRRNLGIAQALAEARPRGHREHQDVARALCSLGELELLAGQRPAAREVFARLLEDDRVLSSLDPQHAWAALDLVLLHAEPPEGSTSPSAEPPRHVLPPSRPDGGRAVDRPARGAPDDTSLVERSEP